MLTSVMSTQTASKKRPGVLDRVMRWKLFEVWHRHRAMAESVVLPPRIDQLYTKPVNMNSTTPSRHPREEAILPPNGNSRSADERMSRSGCRENGIDSAVSSRCVNSSPARTITTPSCSVDAVDESTRQTVPAPAARNHCCSHLLHPASVPATRTRLPRVGGRGSEYAHSPANDTARTFTLSAKRSPSDPSRRAHNTSSVQPSHHSCANSSDTSNVAASAATSTFVYSQAAPRVNAQLVHRMSDTRRSDNDWIGVHDTHASIMLNFHSSDPATPRVAPPQTVTVESAVLQQHQQEQQPNQQPSLSTATPEPLHGDTINLIIKSPTELEMMRRRRKEQLRAQNNSAQAPVVVQVEKEDLELCTRGVTLIDYVEGVVAHREKNIRHLGRRASVAEAGAMPAPGTVVYEYRTTSKAGNTQGIGPMNNKKKGVPSASAPSSTAFDHTCAPRVTQSAREPLKHMHCIGKSKRQIDSTFPRNDRTGADCSHSNEAHQQQRSRHNRHLFFRQHKECWPQLNAPEPISIDELMSHPLLLVKERRRTRWKSLDHHRVSSEELYNVPVPYTATSAALNEDPATTRASNIVGDSSSRTPLQFRAHSDCVSTIASPVTAPKVRLSSGALPDIAPQRKPDRSDVATHSKLTPSKQDGPGGPQSSISLHVLELAATTSGGAAHALEISCPVEYFPSAARDDGIASIKLATTAVSSSSPTTMQNVAFLPPQHCRFGSSHPRHHPDSNELSDWTLINEAARSSSRIGVTSRTSSMCIQ